MTTLEMLEVIEILLSALTDDTGRRDRALEILRSIRAELPPEGGAAPERETPGL